MLNSKIESIFPSFASIQVRACGFQKSKKSIRKPLDLLFFTLAGKSWVVLEVVEGPSAASHLLGHEVLEQVAKNHPSAHKGSVKAQVATGHLDQTDDALVVVLTAPRLSQEETSAT